MTYHIFAPVSIADIAEVIGSRMMGYTVINDEVVQMLGHSFHHLTTVRKNTIETIVSYKLILNVDSDIR